MNWVDLWGLWKKEIHSGSEEYGGTLQWAQDVGFTKGQAQIIADECNFVDSPISGKAPYPVIGDQSYHFNTNPDAKDGSLGDSRLIVAEEHLEKAIELQKKANESEGTFDAIIFEMDALAELGTGLHAVQDISAHTGDFVDDKLVGLDIYNHLGEKGTFADEPIDPKTGELNERYYQAKKDTEEYLKRFKRETECK